MRAYMRTFSHIHYHFFFFAFIAYIFKQHCTYSYIRPLLWHIISGHMQILILMTPFSGDPALQWSQKYTIVSIEGQCHWKTFIYYQNLRASIQDVLEKRELATQLVFLEPIRNDMKPSLISPKDSTDFFFVGQIALIREHCYFPGTMQSSSYCFS